MKKLVWIIMLLVSISVAYAEEGNVTVNTFKVWVGDTNQNVDWEDTKITVNPGDIVEIQINYLNNYNTNTFVQTNIEAVDIDDYDSITRDSSITISANTKKSVTYEFTVPTDVRIDTYDLDIWYTYSKNVSGTTNTSYRHERTFNLDVRKPVTDSNDVLINLTREFVSQKNESNYLLKTIVDMTVLSNKLSDCQTNLSICRGEQGRLTEIEGYKGKFENESIKANDLITQLANCNAQKNNMFSQDIVDDKIKTAKNEQSQADNKWILWAIIGGIVFWIYINNQKKVGGQGEGKPLTGTWK